MEGHIDDVCLGTDTEEDDLILSGELFAVCQENNTRLKLEKCEFMQETVPGVRHWLWVAKPLMDAKVRQADPKKGLHDVLSFICVCNFYHHHIKNFTYTSAILTDLIKKSTTWRWGPQEQQAFDELKDKVAIAECLRVPSAQGEIILVTDAGNVAGGGTLLVLYWCYPLSPDCWGATQWFGCVTENRSATSRRDPHLSRLGSDAGGPT